MTNPSVNKNKNLPVRRWLLGLALAAILARQDARAAQSPIALSSAANFAVLAGTTVTSDGVTTIYGNVGVSPGTTLTGPATVIGSIDLGDPTAGHAQSDLTTAYNNAAGRTDGTVAVAGNIAGQTLAPGLYTSTSSLQITGGILTLDAANDTNAVWIFQMASTLTTGPGSQVSLIRGAQAANVYWQVGSSATLGTASSFKGNILAYTSVALNNGAMLEGRALAANGAVTLAGNSLTNDMPLPPIFGPTSRAANGAVTLTITNTPGILLTLQSSPDLMTWSTLTNFTPGITPYLYLDNTASGQTNRFYRAVHQ